jgi:hypothetical protein
MVEAPGTTGNYLLIAAKLSKSDPQVFGTTAHTLKYLGQTFTGDNWGALIRGGMAAEEMSTSISGLAKGASIAGKALPWVQLGVGFAQIGVDVHEGDMANATYDGINTALGMGSLVPGPVGWVCLGGTAVMTTAKIIDPDIAEHIAGGIDATTDAVGELASDTGEALSDAGSAVGDAWDSIF